ncbi:MAG: cysteine--tRNA ligase [Candidatus Micrarchaeia archaeon]|jgi:cysteinyl-tRNA synthetase
MGLKIYNTLGRRVQNFKSIHKGEVGLYTCGPTVYWFAHIGNMRTYVQEDLLKRVLIHNGYKVKHVMNITDVGHLVGDSSIGEDKVKLEARKEHKSAYDVARFYEEAFVKDIKRLNIIMPDVMPRATEHIEEMLKLIKKLDEKGYLYEVSTGIYYDTSKFKRYGELTGMTFEELNKYLKAGARVERAAGLRNITDFAVWRFAKKGETEMVWDSEWGRGFPGWHIECSAMSMKYLGEHFDIHCGGIDHIPIHHTNEIAQSEAATGKKFVNYWVHIAFLTVNNMKMAKSLGNIYTVQDIIDKGYSPLALRFFLLSSHYRSQQNFTFEALESAANTLKSIYNFLRALNSAKEEKKPEKEALQEIEKRRKAFFDELDNDLNMPNALKEMHALISYENRRLGEGKVGKEEAKKAIEAMLEFDTILGLDFAKELKERELPEEVKKLIEEREIARKEKNFEKADMIRSEIEKRFGIIIEDTKEGVKWRYK